MRSAAWLVLALGVVACTKRDEERMERRFVDREIPKLEHALAEGTESHVITGCAMLESSRPDMPAEIVAKIERLCDVEAPRLFLRNAIAKVTADKAKYPDQDQIQTDISCFQLFVGEAYKAIARQKVRDPETDKLAAEYARLCPEQAAKRGAP